MDMDSAVAGHWSAFLLTNPPWMQEKLKTEGGGGGSVLSIPYHGNNRQRNVNTVKTKVLNLIPCSVSDVERDK